MVSVAICTRNRAGLLEKAVLSVLPQLHENELLIVDNGSTDTTADFCARMTRENTHVRIYQETEPGLSVARNLALREAKGDWVIFLDDDAMAEPGWLAAYETFFSQSAASQAAVAGGAVRPWYETAAPDWLPEPPLPPDASVAARRCAPGESVIGCNFAIQRKLALEAGGFNPRLGHRGTVPGAYDEIELIEKLTKAGHEIWWVTGASVKHLVGSDRLSLTWQLACAFRVGHCSAIRRLGQKSGKMNCVRFALLRLLAAPFQCIVYLLVAAANLLLCKQRKAVRSLMRASSISGFACELFRRLFGQGSAR
jgi:GT2 family glycosyltransferase